MGYTDVKIVYILSERLINAVKTDRAEPS